MAKCWLLLLFLVFLLRAARATSCHPDDLRALWGFAGNMSGRGVHSLRAAWSGTSCCGWEGVGCDDASGRVTALRLPRRGLAGPIPLWIGDIDNLCYLDLSGNSLAGEVPKSLQLRLKSLTTDSRSLGMAFTDMPLHVKRNRRTLGEQPNTITGSNNTIKSGSNNVVSGSNNIVISGNNNVVTGSNHVVSGSNHVVTVNNNVVSGYDNVVSGSFHTVSGSHNVVSGSKNTVTGSNDVVSGSNHVVHESNKVVTGG